MGIFDAIAFIQTLRVIYDIRTVIFTLHRILKLGEGFWRPLQAWRNSPWRISINGAGI